MSNVMKVEGAKDPREEHRRHYIDGYNVKGLKGHFNKNDFLLHLN
jgi:hypothetical protein